MAIEIRIDRQFGLSTADQLLIISGGYLPGARESDLVSQAVEVLVDTETGEIVGRVEPKSTLEIRIEAEKQKKT